MSVLSACQSAAVRLVGQRPSTLFSTTDQLAMELAELANETAVAIAKAHDWQALTTAWTLNGDASATAFDLPSDYDRMPLKANFYSTRSQFPLVRAEDLDQWTEFQITPVVGAPGYWIILGGQLQILPALATGESARSYYITNQIVSGGKTAFTADADTFVLPERLITLGVIWRWKDLKGKEYAEDLKNFEIAFAEEAGRDKGSRTLAIGRARVPDGAQLAYPGVIV